MSSGRRRGEEGEGQVLKQEGRGGTVTLMSAAGVSSCLTSTVSSFHCSCSETCSIVWTDSGNHVLCLVQKSDSAAVWSSDLRWTVSDGHPSVRPSGRAA